MSNLIPALYLSSFFLNTRFIIRISISKSRVLIPPNVADSMKSLYGALVFQCWANSKMIRLFCPGVREVISRLFPQFTISPTTRHGIFFILITTPKSPRKNTFRKVLHYNFLITRTKLKNYNLNFLFIIVFHRKPI